MGMDWPSRGSFQTARKHVQLRNDLPKPFARAIPGVCVRDKYLHVPHIWGNPNVFAV